jgi:hypothetical protein
VEDVDICKIDAQITADDRCDQRRTPNIMMVVSERRDDVDDEAED